MPKTILITGACGFIGKNLIKYLLNNNVQKIIAIDNFISSNEKEFMEFKKEFDQVNKVELYKLDITKQDFCSNIKTKIFNVDEIYHLASIASPPLYKKFPLETMNVGYIGTKNVLDLAIYYNAKLLFSSTSEVYGDPDVSPQNENYRGNVNSFGARSSYDESKRIAEALCYTYIKDFNVDIKIARIFNTYGPRMLLNDGRIITETIKHLLNDTTLQIFGDGQQTRSCCYIDDTVEQLVKLMASDCNIPVNIGNNIELTINELVNTIEQVYQEYLAEKIEIKLKKEYVPLTQDDPLKRQPCLKRNNEILGERKYVSFEKGIREMIEFYLNQ